MIQKIKNKIREIRFLNKKAAFFNKIGISKVDQEQYTQELHDSKLIPYIKEQKNEFEKDAAGKQVRGREFTFGGLGENESFDMYCLIRALKPQTVVETGVCNGVSSAIILKAMQKNGSGELISIDLPEIEGLEYKNGTFWAGKGGAVIPKEKTPGWIVPNDLRDRWSLLLGKSQDILPGLLKEQGEIDIFIHDSEHSYECMYFEYETAFPHIKEGGLLISDDIFANGAFDNFSWKMKRKQDFLTYAVGIIVK